MEYLKNCKFMIDIETIDQIVGGNQEFDVIATTQDKKTIKISFILVWDLRYIIVNADSDRFTKFNKGHIKNSNILLVENSAYIDYFAKQVSGTRFVDKLKDYLLYDSAGTQVEVLTISDPVITEL